jgi:hypothetical protein
VGIYGISALGVACRDRLGLQKFLCHCEAIFDVGDEPVRAEVRTAPAAPAAPALEKKTSKVSRSADTSQSKVFENYVACSLIKGFKG